MLEIERFPPATDTPGYLIGMNRVLDMLEAPRLPVVRQVQALAGGWGHPVVSQIAVSSVTDMAYSSSRGVSRILNNHLLHSSFIEQHKIAVGSTSCPIVRY
jgi:hypothetical protein